MKPALQPIDLVLGTQQWIALQLRLWERYSRCAGCSRDERQVPIVTDSCATCWHSGRFA